MYTCSVVEWVAVSLEMWHQLQPAPSLDTAFRICSLTAMPRLHNPLSCNRWHNKLVTVPVQLMSKLMQNVWKQMKAIRHLVNGHGKPLHSVKVSSNQLNKFSVWERGKGE
ncbi:hypothetical protein DPX39_090041600 [Trypanosoma brucei equiperdum]|uniref:Uncharacterized protein n=1 Tax=Trypanosoma brucei equiperdum TaxID=630700 RepID=A0A3L6L286_9TRYP|nr:hypothetical protein DPX39_090041600 [Trypanosoma brucei equiperdum]